MTVHVLDESPKTDAAFGTSPDDRTLEQRLASGFILVDKPAARPPINWRLGHATFWASIGSATVGRSIRLLPACCP